MLKFGLDRINFKFERHPLLVPFRIGNKPPMTELETVKVTIGGEAGIQGVGRATLANVWAGVELDAMRDLAPMIRDVLIGREFLHPLGLYHETREALMRLAGLGGLNRTAVEVVFSAYDGAAWDLFSRKFFVHPCQTLSNDFLGDDLLGYYEGVGFEDVIRPKPRRSLILMYTHGGTGRLFAHPDIPFEERMTGLVGVCHNEGRKVVKVKCVGDIETDIREILTVHALTRGISQGLWLDYNGSAPNVNTVVDLLTYLDDLAPSVYAAIIAVEQPLAPEVFPENNVMRIAAYKPVYIDESALDIESVQKAKELGYTGVVGKTGKGMSSCVEMAREAQIKGMRFTMQDLTNFKEAFWQSVGTSAYIKNLAHNLVEGNQGQFLRAPHPVLQITKGKVSTNHLTGPGFC